MTDIHDSNSGTWCAIGCTMHPLQALAEAEKAISAFPGWSAPEPETGYIWFDAPLEIGGVTEQGFVLHGGCLVFQPECNVSFEIRINKSPGRRCVPLMRICWRSLKGGHTNPRRAGEEMSGRRLGDTHFHTFDRNWLAENGRMRAGNLRMAQAIEQDIQSFTALRDFVGKQFRINNIDVVTVPDWEYRLDL
jgi:hypothetical protein